MGMGMGFRQAWHRVSSPAVQGPPAGSWTTGGGSTMTTRTRTRTRTITATFASVVASVAAVLGLGGLSAQAATTYGCPLSGSTVCTSPLAGTVHGDVTVTGDGYGFNLSGNGTPGYVAVDNSNQISMGSFPVSFSAQVKGVGVPSSQVGDYDVVRGTPN